jgi:hypothetical protein
MKCDNQASCLNTIHPSRLLNEAFTSPSEHVQKLQQAVPSAGCSFNICEFPLCIYRISNHVLPLFFFLYNSKKLSYHYPRRLPGYLHSDTISDISVHSYTSACHSLKLHYPTMYGNTGMWNQMHTGPNRSYRWGPENAQGRPTRELPLQSQRHNPHDQ